MASARLVKTVYRSLLREARRFEMRTETLRLPFNMQLPLIATRYGRGSYSGATPAHDLQHAWFPKLRVAEISSKYAETTTFTGEDIRKIARAAFRNPDLGLSVDDAITSLSTINRIRSGAACNTVTTTTHTAGTEVTVEMNTAFLGYLPEHVLAQAGHWPFAYRVRVSNTGNKVVQLVSRHWVFESEDGGNIEVPKGSAGVVGHAPVLEPGQAFEYYSGTQLTAPRGSVRGSFTMVVGATDERFEAHVGRTALMGPSTAKGTGQQAAGEKTKAKAG